MGKSSMRKTSQGKNGGVGKKQQKKRPISTAERKRTKLQVERLNKSSETMIPTLLNEASKQDLDNKKIRSTLEAEGLVKDQMRDSKVREQIETEKSKTNDNMLKQIKMISGFSL
ncbi:actin depolymerizing factor, cofilin [Saccharomyces pastorianus]|uniref:Actin depolymerizing factor, cofilin n=1 Tax=Saccharomyces pastorianus TaxID=27292 RepID=A0A6C1E3Y5_SACPS|nr:actin depolymerizing factor, cofilin [Saccharomyces pastorianus]